MPRTLRELRGAVGVPIGGCLGPIAIREARAGIWYKSRTWHADAIGLDAFYSFLVEGWLW